VIVADAQGAPIPISAAGYAHKLGK
jgi:hypothetical protein